MAGAKIALGSTSGELKTDGSDNAAVNLPLTETIAGFASITTEQDGGDVVGSKRMKNLELSEDYRLRVGVDSTMLNHRFVGSVLNSAIWTAPVTTLTAVVGGGYLTLNAGLSTATSVVARVTSYPLYQIGGAGLIFSTRGQFPQTPQANNVVEWGMVISTASTAPTDGAFFRLNASQELRCVTNVNGTESQSAALNFSTLISTNTTRQFIIDITEARANFWIDDVLVATVGTTGAGPIGSNGLPVSFRTYHTGVLGAAQAPKFSQVSVVAADVDAPMDPADRLCHAGAHASQGQTGGTMGTTASYANSADPTAAAALSNTAALVTGLGGQARFNAPATAVTDGIVTSYQVPAGTAALPGRTLMVTSVAISSLNLGAAVATTGTALAWSLAYGHTAVSLATTESATTKAPRRVALGFQSWPVAAPIGAPPSGGDIVLDFSKAPIPVYPGEFVASVAKCPLGTATASQVIWCHVVINGYYV